MNTAQLLDQLAPLREPTAIGWWPLAAGWWLIVIIAILLIGILSAVLLKLWRKNQYRRIATRQLKALQARDRPTVEQINRLLKATALRTWPEREVAALHGAQWLSRLCYSAPKAGDVWVQSLEQVYRAPSAPAPDELLLGAALWIRHHSAHRNGEAA